MKDIYSSFDTPSYPRLLIVVLLFLFIFAPLIISQQQSRSPNYAFAQTCGLLAPSAYLKPIATEYMGDAEDGSEDGVVDYYLRSDSWDGRSRTDDGTELGTAEDVPEEVAERFTNLVREGKIYYRKLYTLAPGSITGDVADYFLNGPDWTHGRQVDDRDFFVTPPNDAITTLIRQVTNENIFVKDLCDPTPTPTGTITPTPTPAPPPPPCARGIGSAGQPTNDQSQIVTCTEVTTAIGPISTDLESFVKTIFGILLSLSGGIALLLIIYSGYRIMTSSGKPETLQSAREALTSAIIGLLFIIFSLVILEVIGVDILKIPGFSP